jgi:hypothetical protein
VFLQSIKAATPKTGRDGDYSRSPRHSQHPTVPSGGNLEKKELRPIEQNRGAGDAAAIPLAKPIGCGAGATPPAIIRDMLSSPGRPLDASTRASTASRLNFDFSNIRIHTGDSAHQAAVALGAPAFIWGEDVGFAKGAYPGFSHSGRLLAHELAHYVQQQHGETGSLAAGRNQSENARLERQAETNLSAVAAGGRLPRRHPVGPPAPVLQRFDPEYHEDSLTKGLAGTFTPAEIGKIYEANWKRDFSQASPAFADIALVWKQLKAAATPAEQRMLQLKLAGKIAAGTTSLFLGQTLGGYQSWEHMDNPQKEADDDADARWSGSSQGAGIAGYIQDSRAYIKQSLAQAVGIARQSRNPPDDNFGRRMADAWAKGTPPQDYDVTDAYAGRTRPPMGLGTPKNVKNPTESSAVIASEVAEKARKLPKATIATKGFADDPQVADCLGRASHALEDFFAHSNFVELTTKAASGKPIGPRELHTGTFGGGDKAHSIADKIRTLAEEIATHRNLMPEDILPTWILIYFLGLASALDAGASVTTGAGSHTALNKDEPSRPNFAMALKLATQADHLVFESIHRAFQAELPETSSQIVYDTYALIDALVNIPSKTHPLKAIYEGVKGDEPQDRASPGPRVQGGR